MRKSQIKILIYLFVLFLVAGCVYNPSNPDYGLLKLNINYEISSRTILYTLNQEDVEQLRVEFISGPETHDIVYLTSGESDYNIFLLPGSWTVEIFGINSSGADIVSAVLAFEIEKTAATVVSATLEAMTDDDSELDASGSVLAVIDWSSIGSEWLSEVTGIEAYWGQPGSNPADFSSQLDLSNMASGTALFGIDPCPSGNYTLEIHLLNSEGTPIAVTSEAVNVRDNLVSSGTVLLNQDDFNLSGVIITIAIDIPQDEIVTFNYSNDSILTSAELSAGITISAVSDNTYDSYIWSMYGYDLSSYTGDSVVLPSDLENGVYHLTIFVEYEGDLFSKTFRFIVSG